MPQSIGRAGSSAAPGATRTRGCGSNRVSTATLSTDSRTPATISKFCPRLTPTRWDMPAGWCCVRTAPARALTIHAPMAAPRDYEFASLLSAYFAWDARAGAESDAGRTNASPNCLFDRRTDVPDCGSAAGTCPPACVGDDDFGNSVRTGRLGDRRAPRLDVRRHVLGLRHPGARAENAGAIHARGTRRARQGQCRVAAGVCLFHLRKGEWETAEGRVV